MDKFIAFLVTNNILLYIILIVAVTSLICGIVFGVMVAIKSGDEIYHMVMAGVCIIFAVIGIYLFCSMWSMYNNNPLQSQTKTTTENYDFNNNRETGGHF